MNNNNLPATKKNTKPRTTAEEQRVRTKKIASMLLKGKTRSQIIAHCIKEYGYVESSVTALITKAYKYIKKNFQHDTESMVLQHIELYYDIYQNALSLGDNRNAINALNSIEKLLKLTMPETAIQNNSISLNLDKLSLEELKELINPQ